MASATHQMLLSSTVFDGGNDAYTTFLLHFEGADASTTFTNSALAGTSVVSVSAPAQIDTAQFKFGSASGLFNGATSYLFSSTNGEHAYGTGDFTADFWVRPNAVAARYLLDWRGGPTSVAPSIYLNASNQLRFGHSGVDRITGTTVMATGTWYHVAVARFAGQTRLFLNGIQEGSTYADATNYIADGNRPVVACDWQGVNLFNGWIDELRLSKGVARWTANFTPPAVPYS